MIKYSIIPFLLFFVNTLWAIDRDTSNIFSFDESRVEAELLELSNLERIVLENPGATYDELLIVNPALLKISNPNGFALPANSEITSPGKFPSFWFTFLFSSVGTYFIYGVVAGPISVGIVYFATHKDRIETKKAIWGCVAGTLVGAGIKLVVVNL